MVWFMPGLFRTVLFVDPVLIFTRIIPGIFAVFFLLPSGTGWDLVRDVL
jgi:hypothetical protein